MGLKEAKDNYTKLGSKGFSEQWKKGMQQIPQTTLLKIDIWSLIGGIIGTIIVCVLVVVLSTMPWLVLAFIFSIGLQVSQLIGKYQQLKILKTLNPSDSQEDIEKMMSGIKEEIK